MSLSHNPAMCRASHGGDLRWTYRRECVRVPVGVLLAPMRKLLGSIGILVAHGVGDLLAPIGIILVLMGIAVVPTGDPAEDDGDPAGADGDPTGVDGDTIW